MNPMGSQQFYRPDFARRRADRAAAAIEKSTRLSTRQKGSATRPKQTKQSHPGTKQRKPQNRNPQNQNEQTHPKTKQRKPRGPEGSGRGTKKKSACGSPGSREAEGSITIREAAQDQDGQLHGRRDEVAHNGRMHASQVRTQHLDGRAVARAAQHRGNQN